MTISDVQIHMNNITKLAASAPESWLCIYVCNCWGYQVTPNYTRSNHHHWRQEPQYLGCNWCWRPSFLRRVVEARYRGRGILSQPYMDLETRLILWTFVFPLPQELFLFIDCRFSENEFPTGIESGRLRRNRVNWAVY